MTLNQNPSHLLKSRDFEYLASLILNNFILKTPKHSYRICEIEFYLVSSDHSDLYSHASKIQLLFGKWYFHQFKNGSYKEGTYKGLDLTLGDGKTHFSILIRSIQDLSDFCVIEGPCRSVNKIFEEFNIFKVKDFLKVGEELDAFDIASNLYLQYDEGMPKEQMHKGERIGLSLKYMDFKKRLYRYLIFKDKIKKGKRSLITIV